MRPVRKERLKMSQGITVGSCTDSVCHVYRNGREP